MTEPTLRPFQADDLRHFEDRDRWWRGGRLRAIELERGGPAFTAVCDDQILGAAGVLLTWPGTGSAWVTMRAEAAAHGLWFTRIILRAIADIERAYRLHRLDAVVLEACPVNRRWIEALGFAPERAGRARAYTPDGHDVIRYERLPHE